MDYNTFGIRVSCYSLFSTWLFLTGLFIVSSTSFAQTPDNCDTAGVWNDKSQYLRVYVENDVLKLRGTTDRYFTNGERVDYFFLPKSPHLFEKLFFRFKPSRTRNNNFGVTLGMSMYTPRNLSVEGAIIGDRPYAGLAFASFKMISSEFIRAERLTTEYSLGVIGPIAQQKQVQRWFHKLINSPDPKGWDNQISNDALLNFYFNYEKLLSNPIAALEIIGSVESNLGTLTNFVGLGSTIRIGAFNDYFMNEHGMRSGRCKVHRYMNAADGKRTRSYHRENLDRKWQTYFYIKPFVRTVIDNSLLQGGVFGYKKSPYTLDADQMKRFYLNSEFGSSINYRGAGFTYSQLFRSKEFENAFDSHWGALTLTFKTTN